MNTMPAALRNLLIYTICIPLALFLGYQLSTPMTYETVITVGVILGVLLLPVLLKWHRPILYFSMSASMVLFFLPGRPKLGLVMVVASLTISILQRTLLPGFRFIRVPMMTWPLMVVLAVVMFTMMLQGGFGLSLFGAKTAGGSRYLFLIIGILSYFALTAQPIPREKTNLYLALFYLGGLTAAIGDFFMVMPGFFRPIYLFFPPSSATMGVELEVGVTRLFGVTLMAGAGFRYMLARYGLGGLLGGSNRFRLLLFLAVVVLSMLGGSRLALMSVLLTLAVMFFLEGLHRSRLMVPLVLAGVLASAAVVTFLPKMPFAVQRSLAFLPLPIDPAARMSAEGSSEWRLAMWRALLPEVPNHLLLGRGLGISDTDLESIVSKNFESRTPDQWLWAAIVGDFHNGPLSVVLTFGVWGLIAFTWLQVAGWRLLYLNYRYGNDDLRTLNTFLLAQYSVQVIVFWFVFGSMYSETIVFASMAGFSVAANGGVARAPVPAPLPARPPAWRRRPALAPGQPVAPKL